MRSGPSEERRRKALGAWYTPERLVNHLIDALFTEAWIATRRGRPVRVIDPACGDGRFLVAAARRLAAYGVDYELVGVDIDPNAVESARAAVPGAHIALDDALHRQWPSGDAAGFDVVIGNPPFLTPLSASNDVRRRYGGPLADAAVEFLGLAGDLVDREGGRIGFVLPQSILAARDAEPVRRRIDSIADVVWSRFGSPSDFDAQVVTCSIVFDTTRRRCAGGRDWSALAADAGGVPPLVPLRTAGTLADRARINVGFRSEYYGLVPGVGDDVAGPALVTSGLIDPGVCWWGRRPVRFARRRFEHPRVDLDRLDDRTRTWALERLTPKVLIANQTAVVEAVADVEGDWLPAVPVLAAYSTASSPTTEHAVEEIAAVLTSPIASAWTWHRHAGTGLSPGAVRLSPRLLSGLPWPHGELGRAIAALAQGDVVGCGTAVVEAYGAEPRRAEALVSWWVSACDRIARRAPAASHDRGGAPGGPGGGPSAGAAASRASRRSSTTA